jgi:ABC-type transporter Mla MlaB component
LRLQDEFELAALDYCVIYEVSPPPWQDAQCEFLQKSEATANPQRDSSALRNAGVADQFADVNLAATAPMDLDSMSACVVELSGEILGDAAQALNRMQAGLTGTNRLVISCARLIRVDFSAAGSILNWVAVREAEGCHVQFRDVPRLVASFFNVIGINEHARIILRNS